MLTRVNYWPLKNRRLNIMLCTGLQSIGQANQDSLQRRKVGRLGFRNIFIKTWKCSRESKAVKRKQQS